MRTYSWKEYYEKFYDWAESTQVRNLSYLTSIGNADEVAEIIIELQINVPAANRLLKKAVDKKLTFKVDDLIEFLCICNKELSTKAVYNSAKQLSNDDMEELYGFIDDEIIIDICNKNSLLLPEDLREDDEEELEELDEEINECEEFSDEDDEPDEVYDESFEQESNEPGFFTTLFALFGARESINQNNKPKKHNGRCNGDCANCPPHYGYRYGRWYYGHHHNHGCEFGGNKGL